MSRRIIADEFHAAGSQKVPDTYFDRVIKYIPADVVAAWTAATGLIASSGNAAQNTLLWISFIVGLVFTAGWTYRQTAVPKMKTATTQIGIATVAFAVWVFALGGGPFASLSWYDPVYGSLLLIAYTLLIALIVPKEGLQGT